MLIIEPRVFKDSRGYFLESFSQREFDKKVMPILGHNIHSCKTKNQCHHQQSIISNQSSLIGLQFFIPRGFAHGFAVLSETAVFQYKCDEFYHPEADGGINIKDESLGIDWRIPLEKAILSEKDLSTHVLKTQCK